MPPYCVQYRLCSLDPTVYSMLRPRPPNRFVRLADIRSRVSGVRTLGASPPRGSTIFARARPGRVPHAYPACGIPVAVRTGTTCRTPLTPTTTQALAHAALG